MSLFCVIGDRPWGEALAARIAANGNDVRLVGSKASRKRLPSGVRQTTDLAAALGEVERLVFADAAEQIEARLREAAPHLEGHHRIATTGRRLTPETNLRPSEAVSALTCVRQIAVLAGSADSRTLEAERPVALVVGSAFPTWASELQKALASPSLRVYTNPDLIGVELSNVLATILAVALGVAHAAQMGSAAEATALTRATAEADRLVRGLGGQPGTAFGLAGLGVLAAQTSDADGEAWAAGRAIVGNEPLDGRFEELRAGARTLAARATAHRLCAPMVEAVDGLLSGQMSPVEAMETLMSRALRAE